MLVPNGQERKIVFVDLGLNPDGRQIGHVVERRAFLDVLSFADVLRDDVAADRRANRQVRSLALSAASDLVDLCVVDAQQFQPRRERSFIELLIAAAFGVEQVLHRDQQVGTVEQRQDRRRLRPFARSR